MSKKLAFSLWMLLLACFTAAAFAQTTASIKGTVTDQSGAAVKGAKIPVKNTAQGIERTATTSDTGSYEVPALSPGKYSVEVEASGFQKLLAQNVVLAVSQNTVQNFSVKVASTTEVVNVEATAPVIESTTIGGPEHRPAYGARNSSQWTTFRRSRPVDSRLGDATAEWLFDGTVAGAGIICLQYSRQSRRHRQFHGERHQPE